MTESSSSEDNLDEAHDRLVAGEFAFIDAGCGIGGSISYCEKTFGRGPGIGFDSSPGKIERARASGHPVYRADLTSIELPERCVSFVSFLDVLEHLPDIDTTRAILANMERVARDFVFIRHPSFEDIDYLKALGLKLNWTDWHGHPNMMSLADFDLLFRELGWSAPSVFGQKPIVDSNHPAIVPIDAPRDSKEYDHELHSDKPYCRFERRIHSQFDIFVRINRKIPDSDWMKIVHSVRSRRHQTTPLPGLGAVD